MSADQPTIVALPFIPGAVPVLSSPEQQRVVEFRVSSDAPIFRAVPLPKDSGGEPMSGDKLNEIDGRLRSVETDVATIKERLNHMPTTVGMWAALIGVVVPVGAAVVGVLWWVIQSSLGPLLQKAAGG